jgi:hypothetical protein
MKFFRQKKVEAARLQDFKETIAWKDAKAQVIQDEKEQTVSQVRADRRSLLQSLARMRIFQRFPDFPEWVFPIL